jgi:hypothetical protein
MGAPRIRNVGRTTWALRAIGAVALLFTTMPAIQTSDESARAQARTGLLRPTATELAVPTRRPPLGVYLCWSSSAPVPIDLFSLHLRRNTYHVAVRGSVSGRWRYNKHNRVITYVNGTLADAPYEGLYVPDGGSGRRESETIFLRHPSDNRDPETGAHPPCYLAK